ncbi:MAG: hypothetical protein IKP64_09225 [Selenomonadaceae bacterium]|nr:hypothetical protein [Selenomonadaceae bacterium]MBR4383724.1 hypothetical protein [Selenomonadaceae bacterium]
MYDPLKDHGGYKGKKDDGNTLGTLLLAALFLGGCFISDKLKARKQKKIWNNGVCEKCGRRWDYHWFYPKGSRGQYKKLAIDCQNCKIHVDMLQYTPEEVPKPC